MGNTLLKNNPTIQDIKNFLGKIEENIETKSITIDEPNETLIFSTSTVTVINR